MKREYKEVEALINKYKSKKPLTKKDEKKAASTDTRISLSRLRTQNYIFKELETAPEADFLKFMEKWGVHSSANGFFDEGYFFKVKKAEGDLFARKLFLTLIKGESGLFENEDKRFKVPHDIDDFIYEIELFQSKIPELKKKKALRRELVVILRKSWEKSVPKHHSFSIIREIYKLFYGDYWCTKKDLARIRTKIKRARKGKFLP